MVARHCEKTCKLCTSNSSDLPVESNIYQGRKEDTYNISENPQKDSSEYGIVIDEKGEMHKVPAFETSDVKENQKGSFVLKEQLETSTYFQSY